MEYHIYRTSELISDRKLVGLLLDTMTDNLSWLYGEDMGSKENREKWIRYNLYADDPVLKAAVGECLPEICGFILYSVEDRRLVFHDVEIVKKHRFNPKLLIGLFGTLFTAEADGFDTMSGYINKKNEVSLSNFLRYATDIEDRPRGYSFVTDAEATRKIVGRFTGPQVR